MRCRRRVSGVSEMKLTDEQKERFLSRVRTVVESDVLTLPDVSAILEICLNAAKREEAALAEAMLVEMLSDDAPRSE